MTAQPTLWEEEELGIFTPETTYQRALKLNNAFARLWSRAPTDIKFGELDQVMQGYDAYFQELRNNWTARFTEWGELEKWEKQYEKMRAKVAASGVDMRGVTVIIPQEPPGASFGSGFGSGIGVAVVALGAAWILLGRRGK